ncbi:MAG: hypothetical protein WCK65_08065 [Rhodospirillaceae bacterium]
MGKLGRVIATVALGTSLLYPLIVYLLRQQVPPLALVAFAFAVIGVRLLTLHHEMARLWRVPLLAAAGGLAILAALDRTLAVLAYPVLLSSGMAVLFGQSLLRPPSLIERFARLTDPTFPPEGVSYCRMVTVVWTLFLMANAAVAAGLALWSTPEVWALWTGLVAYILMGMLFAGEYAVRQLVQRRRKAA